MRPGPAPKPTAIKIAQGNPGRRRLNDREPDARIISRLPTPPDELGARGARMWKVYGRELIEAGLLTVLGLPCLRRWCIAFEIYETARELVAKTGIVLPAKGGGGAYLNPAYNAQSMAAKEMHQCELEFGMTPASATRVKVANPKQLDLFGQLFEDDANSDYSLPPDDEALN
jgi:P27 family predicted phage terminase small subunit